jgi:hypothetical protein
MMLIITGVVFQAAAEETQAPSDEATVKVVAAVDSEPSSDKNASEAREPEVLEPQAEAMVEPEATVEPETTDETILVEIPDEQVPLADGQEPSVIVRANRNLSALEIGDSLVLTCELSGFGGLGYEIRWQALVNGEWRNLPGEDSDTLTIRITSENADWAYRAAVDAQPV